MNKNVKESVTWLINNCIEHIKNPSAAEFKKKNPLWFKRAHVQNKKYVNKKISVIKSWNKELYPYIKYIKKSVPDITSQTTICAVYLLLEYNQKLWQSFIHLARKGHYSAGMTNLRSINEVSTLIQHFTFEYKSGKNTDLKKWFSGEIIPHRNGRKSINEFLNRHIISEVEKGGVDIEKLQSEIYQIESLTPHSSYVAMLEIISPFTKDIDFTNRTDYFRMQRSMNFALGTLGDYNTAMQVVFLFLCPDLNKYSELRLINEKYNPNLIDLDFAEEYFNFLRNRSGPE